MNGDYLLQLSNLRGAFDNEHLVLPRTKYDVEIDRDSPRPGQQAFEKMIAGYYLGEVFRLVLLDLHAQGAIFEGKSLTKLHEPYSIDTSTLAEIESDPFENLIETGDMFIQKFGLECTEPELRLIRRLAFAALRLDLRCPQPTSGGFRSGATKYLREAVWGNAKPLCPAAQQRLGLARRAQPAQPSRSNPGGYMRYRLGRSLRRTGPRCALRGVKERLGRRDRRHHRF